MTNSADPDQRAISRAFRSGFTLFAKNTETRILGDPLTCTTDNAGLPQYIIQSQLSACTLNL